jgi:hypothetical protein
MNFSDWFLSNFLSNFFSYFFDDCLICFSWCGLFEVILDGLSGWLNDSFFDFFLSWVLSLFSISLNNFFSCFIDDVLISFCWCCFFDDFFNSFLCWFNYFFLDDFYFLFCYLLKVCFYSCFLDSLLYCF